MGFALCCNTTEPVAINVWAGKITSSPSPTPAKTNARWSAEVPELTVTGFKIPNFEWFEF